MDAFRTIPLENPTILKFTTERETWSSTLELGELIRYGAIVRFVTIYN
jgi:hypothetical protein